MILVSIKPDSNKKDSGFTVVEIVMALTVLSIGSAMLWYTLRSSARLERINRLHHEANILARSELESLRSIPRADIRDTSYRMTVMGEEILIVREVFDSAKVVSSLRELVLDEHMNPVELRKPLEVRVRVLRTRSSEGEALPDPSGSWSPPDAGDAPQPALSILSLKIPEYKWH